MCADDDQIPSIEDSVLLNPSFPTVSERYFTHYYYVPKKQIAKAVDASTTALSSQESKELQHQGVLQSENKEPMEENDPMSDWPSNSKNSTERSIDHNDDLPCKKRLKLEDDCKKGTATSDSQQLNDGQKCPINNDLVERMNLGAVISTINLKNSGENTTSVSTPECAELGSAAEDVLNSCTKVDPDDKEYCLTGSETLVMVHSNKLCVVSLSPYHPIVRDNKTVIKVEYEVFGIDRLSNKVSGKGKRGAQVMGSKATLCRLHTSDGTAYDVTCGARGKLVQVNKRLLENPDMARSHCGAEGWLGVVMPSLQHYDALMAAMMPACRYKEAFQKQFGEQGL